MTDANPVVSRTLWSRGGKRLFDLLASVVLLVLLSPVWLITIVLIKLTSPGPVMFVQERVGKDGLIFKPLKFRTMRAGRRPDPNELVPLGHAEITPVGRRLRRFKIDELPQLINVLAGEMSLVGPRPTLPDQVERYDDFRRQRLFVRPGITGLAQVHGNTAISWDQRILYDIAYVRRCSVALDLLVVFKTIAVIPLGEAGGVLRFQDSPYAKYVAVPEGYD